ncbi:MAG: DUF58 domain-containing protein [Infirmifilum sp.]
MKLTERGKDVLLSLTAEAIFAALFWDSLLFVTSILLSLLLVLDALTAYKQASRDKEVLQFVKLPTLKLKAGTTREVSVELPRAITSEIHPSQDWVTIATEGRKLRIRVTPRVFGKADVTFSVHSRTRIGLWVAEKSTRLTMHVLALPRAAPLIATAALALAGDKLLGDIEDQKKESSTSLFSGLEYKGSRPYQPGDRQIRYDWPATARHLELMIRDYVATGGAAALVANLDSPGPSVLDFTVSALLSAALAAWREGLEVVLYTVVDGVVTSTPLLDAKQALAVTLKLSLERLSLGYEALEYILPEPSTSLASIAAQLGALSLESALSARALTARLLAEELSRSGLAVYCGSLSSNTQLLVDTLSLLKPGTRIVFIVHPKPWVDAKTEKERRALESTHKRMEGFLKKRYRILSTPQAAEREVALYALALRATGPQQPIA